MAHGRYPVSAYDLVRNHQTICSVDALKAPTRRCLAPALSTAVSRPDPRCTLAASQIGVPTRPRFPSLAAFERRPGRLRACGELHDGAGIRNPSQEQTFRVMLTAGHCPCDGPSAIHKDSRDRTQGPIFQSHDSNRPGLSWYFDRQNFERPVSTAELHQRSGQHRDKAAGGDKLQEQVNGLCVEWRMRHLQPALTEDRCNQCSGEAVRWWQNPLLIT